MQRARIVLGLLMLAVSSSGAQRIDRDSMIAYGSTPRVSCPIGAEGVVECDLTENSDVLHNVTHGTAKLGATGQQFTTNGTYDSPPWKALSARWVSRLWELGSPRGNAT